MSGPCLCWINTYAIGHDGHCCFLVDDRDALPRDKAWRTDGDVCHVARSIPAAVTPEEQP